MRLIDADTLMEKEYSRLREGEVLHRIPPSHVDAAPTIDAVPVVRCKDCKYMEISEKTGGRYCHVWGFFNGAGDDGFCNYGKRRDDQP